MAEQQKRQTAHKIQIKSILDGKFVKQEGWTPNYVVDEFGRKISRVNLIVAVVDLPNTEDTFNYYSLVLDDGSGRISTRIFEDYERFKSINLGDVVQIIGRIREYGAERYISPEIIKKIDNKKWIDVRKKEIELIKKNFSKNQIVSEKKEISEKKAEPVVEEIIEDELSPKDLSGKIISLIIELDKGSGADIDEIIKQSGIKDCEKRINSLMLEGDIFEINPGILKVLD